MSKRKWIAVYIMTNKHNTVLYVGVTSDLLRRVSEHKLQLIKNSFTTKYNLNKLVWHQNFERMENAIRREKQIKRWRRVKKEMIIEEMNPEWKDLMPDLPVK